jgi:hypothetical protein
MRKLLIAALLATLAAAAAAQGVYKYTDKDGRVVYTDDPKAAAAGAQPVEDRTSTSISDPAASGSARQMIEQADKRAAALDRATSDIAAAQNALDAAIARKESGVEPVGDERQGRRFRPEYWQRQQKLENDVAAARAKLDEALARRNALR